MTTLGQRIKAARERLDMSRRALADAAHVTEAAVGQWESDTTGVKEPTLAQVAKALGVSAQELRYGAPQPSPDYWAGAFKAVRMLQEKVAEVSAAFEQELAASARSQDPIRRASLQVAEGVPSQRAAAPDAPAARPTRARTAGRRSSAD